MENRIRNEIPVSVPWRTLTPPLLSEVLRLPAMTTATDQAVKLLLDQAGAWDLLHFEKPSDILASWQRWFPSEPGFHPNPTGWVIPQLNYYATGDYSDEAGAWMILSHCLPPPAWLAQNIEPMILTLEQGDNWDVARTYEFGRCIRTLSETGKIGSGNAPDTARGLRSAVVLDRKLTSYLRKNGCSGKGPDNCLVLLHALLSLTPKSPDLVSIAHSIGSSFKGQLDTSSSMFGVATGSHSNEYAQGIRRDLVRQLLFLDAWIAILVELRTMAWPVTPMMSEMT